MEEIIFRQVFENFRERSTGEDEQTTVGGFADAEMGVEVNFSRFLEGNSQAALMQRRENVHVVDVGVSKPFPVVDQKQPVLPRLEVMSIAVLDEKVKDRSVDEIEDSRARKLRLHLVAVVAIDVLLPQRLLTFFVGTLPRRFVLEDRSRNLIEEDAFDEVSFVAANGFRPLAVEALPIEANASVVF
jgi:hypothetical protein